MFTVAELTTRSNGTTHTTHQTHSEANVSLNTFVEADGLRIQVTGRGATADEAVSHLREAVQALQTPPAPPTRTAQMAALLAKGIDCAVRTGDMKLVERLSKAAALVLSDAVQPSDSPTVRTVASQTASQHWHDVTVETLACTCVDYYRRHQEGDEKYLCKHGLAVAMTARITN